MILIESTPTEFLSWRFHHSKLDGVKWALLYCSILK